MHDITLWHTRGHRFIIWITFLHNDKRKQHWLMFDGRDESNGFARMVDSGGHVYVVVPEDIREFRVAGYLPPHRTSTMKGLDLGNGLVWGAGQSRQLLDLLSWAETHTMADKILSQL